MLDRIKLNSSTLLDVQDGFYVSPGGEKLIAVVPEVLNTTESALQMTIEDRDCYLDSVYIYWLNYCQ